MRGTSIAILAALSFAPRAFGHSAAGGAYEPRHLLCSMKAGRSVTRSAEEEPNAGAWTARRELIHITPLGHYESHEYVPLEVGAHLTAVQALPSVTHTFSDDWIVSAGLLTNTIAPPASCFPPLYSIGASRN